MKNVEAFIRPENIEEVLENMALPGALALAGGTTVSLSKDPNVLRLVDLSGVGALKAIEVDDDKVVLGAMVTMTDILQTEIPLPAALRLAARAVSSTPIRNMVTIGGELARGVYWTDLPVALLTLDATVKVCSSASSRLVPVRELYREHPSKNLAPGEIITKVYLPKGHTKSSFIKFAKTEVDYAMLNVSATVQLSADGIFERVQVAIGAVTPLAVPLVAVEEFLVGKKISKETYAQAAQIAAQGLKYRKDFRISSEYQTEMVLVHVARVIENAVSAAGE
ncbi:FAD binding domain-containing protein [Myxococcota bacterium]|nr:FAD binding domain-containing protein [Myxococcota bacterium]